MQDALQAYLQNRISNTAFVINYHVGSEFSGETDFVLRGDGAYQLWSTATTDRQRRTYSGSLEAEQVRQIVQLMLDERIWEVRHIRAKPGDDDPETLIAVEAEQQRFETVLWISEVRHVPAFVRVQEALLKLVGAVSNGEVRESG